MSLGKLSDAGHLGEEFKGLTIEDFLKEIVKTFYKAYGRYENASGKMYFELEHNGADDDHREGSVKWRKGITGGELLEDETLERPEAIEKYTRAVYKGYSLVFQAVTAADFEREHAKQEATYSAMKREGILGAYERGAETFRVNEYEGVYSVEKLYNGMITYGKHQLSEAEARAELATALSDGFAREGADAFVEVSNPFAAWESVTNTVTNEVESESEKLPECAVCLADTANKESCITPDCPNYQLASPDMSALLSAFGD